MFNEIVNRAATFHFLIQDKYTAGMQLLGSEVKSIRDGKANLGDAYCYFNKGELYVKNLHITEYKGANQFNHEPRRERKLLLEKQELKKLSSKVKERGFTIIPMRILLSESGYLKLEIGLAKGKNNANKKDSIKEKDVKREMDRELRRK
jgi:SsrA-binding protein